MAGCGAPSSGPPLGENTQLSSSVIDSSKAHTRFLAGKASLIREIRRELIEDSQNTPSAAPLTLQGYSYEKIMETGASAEKLIRYPEGRPKEWELVFDLAPLVQEMPRASFSALAVCESKDLVAVAIDGVPASFPSLFILSPRFGIQRKGAYPETGALQWSFDCGSLYSLERKEGRNATLVEIRLSPVLERRVLLSASSNKESLSLKKSHSKKFIFVENHSATDTEILYLDGEKSANELRRAFTRVPHRKARIFHLEGAPLLLINEQRPADGQESSSLSEIDLASGNIGPVRFRSSAECSLFDALPMKSYVLLLERCEGGPRLSKLFPEGARINVELPDKLSEISISAAQNPYSDRARVLVSSPVRPLQPCEIDKVGAALDCAVEALPIKAELLLRHAPASDGQKIPLSLVIPHRRAQGNPLVLRVYGSYGTIQEAGFRPEDLPLLRRGIGVGILHVRGGGEKGVRWHQAGQAEKKLRTIKDTLEALQYLIRKGYGYSLALRGKSAGALAAASALLLEPSLLSVVVLENPFLDPAEVHFGRSTLPYLRELEEWGDPALPDIQNAQRAYSPFRVPIPPRLPPIFIHLGSRDSTISNETALRWITKIAVAPGEEKKILLSVSSQGTHAGEPNLYDELYQEADRLSFLISNLG